MSQSATITPEEAVLRPLARRPRERFGTVKRPPSRYRHGGLPKPPFGLALSRLAVWGWMAASFYSRNLGGFLIGRSGVEWRAKRLAKAMPRAGGTGRSIARIMGMRHDLLPYEHCIALSQVTDEAPPIPLEEALEAIAEVAGRPIEAVFATFDPEAVSSTVVDTTWQAELTDGRRVLVRVRRSGIMWRFAADVQAISWVLSLTDFLTVLPPWTARGIHQDVRDYLLSDLDFVAQARFHRVYDTWLRRDRMRRVSVAKVVEDLSSRQVMVVERVPGVPLADVVDAVARGDQEHLETLRKNGIDPKRLAKDMFELSWWEMYEAMFTHTPQMEDVIVQPGGGLALQWLSKPSMSSSRTRRMYRLAMRHLVRNDVGGAVDAIVQMLSPLPHIDVHTFSRSLERRVGRCLLALSDRESPWEVRTSAPLWVGVLETVREYGVPLKAQQLQLVRASVRFHELSGQLWPKGDLLKAYARYERRADRRAHRRAKKELRRAQRNGLEVTVVSRLSEAAGQLERVSFFVDAVTANPPVQYLSLVGKFAHSASVLLNVVVALTVLAVLATGLTNLASTLLGEELAFLDTATQVIWHPAFLIPAALIGFLGMRRIHTRLLDREEE